MNEVGAVGIENSVEVAGSFRWRCKRRGVRQIQGKQHVIIAFPRQLKSMVSTSARDIPGNVCSDLVQSRI